MSLSLLFADYHGLSDAAYLKRKYEQNRKLFRGLIFRVIVSLSTPATLVGVVSSRWNSVHRGSQLSVDGHREGAATLRLAFPPKLYNELLLLLYAQILRAALDSSNARTSTARLLEFDAASARFEFIWT